MRKKLFFLLIIAFVGLLFGVRWVHLANLSDSSTTAMDYLKDEGFSVLYYKGDYGPYTVTKQDITEQPYSDYFSVQHEIPAFYTDKTLHHEFFYVNNHPLSNLFGLGGVSVTVIMHEDEVVGTFSIKSGKVYGS